MLSSIIAGIAGLPGWNVSLLLLLAKATIILIAALGITISMQRASAGARHLVWLVTLIALVLVPALSAWGPFRLPVLPAERATSALSPIGSALAPPRFSQFDALDENSPRRDGSANVSTASPEGVAAGTTSSNRLLTRVGSMSGIALVLVVWAVVVLGIITSLAWAAMTVRRIVRNARPLDTEDWRTPLWEIADRMGLDDAPRLLRSDEAKMPFACGMLKPTIVLPAECEGWTLDRRRAVLLHELAHVRRHDLFGHTLGRLVCAVYWFHPLVWTAAKQLRTESERACDDLALSCGTRATDYAEHLLDIVTSVRRDTTPSVAMAMARRKEFEGRMLAILDPELRHSSPSRRQSAALIASLALISFTVAATAPVARSASAAATAQTARANESAPPAPAPSAQPAPMARPQYPDSGVRGVMGVFKKTDIDTSTRTATSPSTSASTSASTSTDTIGRTREKFRMNTNTITHAITSEAISSIAGASITLGMNAAATALQQLVKSDKGDKGAKGSKNDDRPLLLARVLKSDTSMTLRRIAAWGLEEYADSPIAAEALQQAVRRDASAAVREMAAWALGHGDDGTAGTTDALVAALKSDANERVRTIAAWALGNIGDHSATDALAAALSDASTDVRIRAAWALGNVEPKQAPRALIALLSDKDVRMREIAAWALFNIEDPASVPALEAALRAEQNKDAQLSYIRALAAMGDKSVDAIRGLLESPDQRVKQMAVRALAGGRAAGPWPWPWPEPRPFP